MTEKASTEPPSKHVTYLLVGGSADPRTDTRKDIPRIRELEAERIAKGELVIIPADNSRTMEETLAAIRPPGEIILLAHGQEHDAAKPNQKPQFVWRANKSEEFRTYEDLYKALPEGISLITNGSCFGERGLDEASLANAPAGVVLQSLINSSMISIDLNTLSVLHERKSSMPSIAPIVSNFDNLNAGENIARVMPNEDLKKFGLDIAENYSHKLAIGGAVNHVMDLQKEREILKNPDANYFKKSIEIVLENFNTQSITADKKNGQVVYEKGSEEAAKLQNRIHMVALNLADGKAIHAPSDNGFEKVLNDRIADALVAAYLDSTHELERRKTLVKQYSALAKQDIIPTGYADGVESFANKFGIPVTTDHSLSAAEEKAIRDALGLSGDSGKRQLLQAMLNVEIKGTLPEKSKGKELPTVER